MPKMHRATDLDDANLGRCSRFIDRLMGNLLDPVLDRVGNVRDDLNRLSEIISPPLSNDALLSAPTRRVTRAELSTNLFLNDFAVDLARRDVVLPSEGNVEVPLVVAEIEICFSSVIQDEHLAW